MLSRNSKARFEMRATKWGETERIKDGVSSLRRGMHFVETFIVYRRNCFGGQSFAFFDRIVRSIFVKRETNWSELRHHRESYIKRDSRWSSSSREGRGREGLCERIIQIENRSSNLRNRDLGWPSRTKFFLILINNAHHVRGFGVLRGTISLSLSSRSKNGALVLHVYTSNWNKFRNGEDGKRDFWIMDMVIEITLLYHVSFSLSLLNNNSNLIVN